MATFEPSPDLDPAVAQAIQEAMDSLREELLGQFAPQQAADAAPQLGSGGGDRLARLETAVEALDAAGTQPELLSTLLEEAGAFAERTLFLVRDGSDLRGWAAYGFGGSASRVDEVVVNAEAELAAGTPADESEVGVAIVDQMAAAGSAASLLVPFALRGNVAGALYADTTSGADGIDRPALRILSYVAAQALETLPLRRGSAAAAVAPVPRAEPEAAPVDEEEAPELEPAPVDELEAPEPESETEDLALEVPEVSELAAEVESSPAKDFDFVPDPAYPTEPETADLEADVDQLIQEVEFDRDTDVTDPDIVAIRQDVTPPDFAPPEDDGTEDSDFDTAIDDIGVATQEMSTVETDIGEQPMAPPVRERTIDAAEVAPPDDLDGPGWAFSASKSISDDTRHEEARRLARLLVTEIKLYNEEKVRQGRENNDVYDQLRDDIERSRRIYEERIDDEVRTEADYFQEEVVRILAGGDSTALGT